MDKILKKYARLKYKKAFKIMLAKKLNKSYDTIDQNWFKGRKSIPENYLKQVENYLTLQLDAYQKIELLETKLHNEIWNS